MVGIEIGTLGFKGNCSTITPPNSTSGYKLKKTERFLIALHSTRTSMLGIESLTN